MLHLNPSLNTLTEEIATYRAHIKGTPPTGYLLGMQAPLLRATLALQTAVIAMLEREVTTAKAERASTLHKLAEVRAAQGRHA